ncbi:hypothetical protein C0Q70_17800 [Pomacea canaliculata]|uniref:Uncharacterized protein n=1 Tax=Pomacea canaliculata TaxID=400727 RepID=A0A2T7NLE6_POMCA|nr:protein STPG3-like isoform X2 [Pomacea canaliculata]PVD21997.1 hypothetical protein C0Q70_17800 [Pomacea canaliculata]
MKRSSGGRVLPAAPNSTTPTLAARGQACVQQMTSSITEAVKGESLLPLRRPVKLRRPAKYASAGTTTVSSVRVRRSLSHGPSLYYEERKAQKVITWSEATNARPPLRIDMEGPTPCTYSPRVKPLQETNAPAFTFGSRCQPEKDGGSRTSWAKTWFQTPHVWLNKVDFGREELWPSPAQYHKPSCLGPRQRTMPEAPSYTFGHRSEYSIVKQGAGKEPSPNEYQPHLADKIVLRRSPAFTHQLRREGTVLWGASEITPGPAFYNPVVPSREAPAFTIRGIRRENTHLPGPYSL